MRPMNPPPVQYATTSDGVNIGYAVFGSGPPIVFAATIFGDVQMTSVPGHQTQLITEKLAAAGWRVVRYDIRGMGCSDRDVSDLSLAARVLDLEAVVESMGLRRFVLAGWDVGAATAVAFAA